MSTVLEEVAERLSRGDPGPNVHMTVLDAHSEDSVAVAFVELDPVNALVFLGQWMNHCQTGEQIKVGPHTFDACNLDLTVRWHHG